MLLFSAGLLVGMLSVPLGAFLLGAFLHLRPKYASGAISFAEAFWFLAPEMRGRSARMHLSRTVGKTLARESLWSLFPEEVHGEVLRKRERAATRYARLPLWLSPTCWKNALRHLLDLPQEKAPKVPLDPDRAAWVAAADQRRRSLVQPPLSSSPTPTPGDAP